MSDNIWSQQSQFQFYQFEIHDRKKAGSSKTNKISFICEHCGDVFKSAIELEYHTKTSGKFSKRKKYMEMCAKAWQKLNPTG